MDRLPFILPVIHELSEAVLFCERCMKLVSIDWSSIYVILQVAAVLVSVALKGAKCDFDGNPANCRWKNIVGQVFLTQFWKALAPCPHQLLCNVFSATLYITIKLHYSELDSMNPTRTRADH